MNELDRTDRGVGSYGNTGIKAVSTETDLKINAVKDKMNNGGEIERKPKSRNDVKINETPLSQSRRLIIARQMSKIAKGDNPVFLAIVCETNDAPLMKKSNKQFSGRAARFAATHVYLKGISGQSIREKAQNRV